MKPVRPRYAKINAEVDRLLTAANVKKAPVPVDKIAAAVGAEVVYRNFNDEVSGLLIRKKGSVVIGVDNKQALQRQRFTIAHEVGHLLLHDGDEVHVDQHFRVNLRSSLSSKAEDVEEIEANAFAAALLMPMAFLMRDLQGETLDIDDEIKISELAKRYGVSVQAMTFRLMNVFALDRGR